MRGDKKSVEHIGIGSILQINPTAGLSFPVKPGMVIVVTGKQTWGANGYVHGGPEGEVGIAWASLEDTGGTLKLDASGQPIKPVETMRHHP